MRQHVETDDNRKTLAEALFQRHAPAVFAYLRQQTTSREDAEDLLLEIFTAVLEHKQLGQLSPDQQKGLLWRITRNKAIDAYRRRKNRLSVSIDAFESDLFADADVIPEYEILRLEEYTRLRSLLQTLSPLQQRVLHLRFIQELRCPQIAALVGKSEVAVRQLISRALNQLRQIYKEGER